jgi:acetolactate synthase-1/2/3 large subunit
VVDFGGSTSPPPEKPARQVRSLLKADCKTANVSLDELVQRAWATDYQQLAAVDLPILADAAAAVPQLLGACRALVEGGKVDQGRIARRAERLGGIRQEVAAAWRQQAEARWNDRPINIRRLSAEVYEAVKGEDWVLAVARGIPIGPATGLWDVREPRQYCGQNGGGGVGYGPGAAVGVALACRDTGKLPVAVTGDGDFLMTCTALWTAVHYKLPLLMVVRNNRSYYNDEEHQLLIARVRNRPEENAWIGMRTEDPPPDMATVARGFGCWAEGPIDDPAALGPALQRAVAQVRAGHVAVLDVICKPR